jgi:hypothetical protein
VLLLIIHLSEIHRIETLYNTLYIYLNYIKLISYYKKNIGIYFLYSLSKFIKGEEVVKASNKVIILFRYIINNSIYFYIKVITKLLF